MTHEQIKNPDPQEAQQFAQQYLDDDRVEDLLGVYWLMVGHGLHIETILSHADQQSVVLETRWRETFISAAFYPVGKHLLGYKQFGGDAYVKTLDMAKLSTTLRRIKDGLP